MKKVQLYSGGLDSYIMSKLWKPDVKLYFDCKTPQAKYEMERLPDDVIIKELPLNEYTLNDGMTTIPLRNLIFTSLAVNYGEIILLGGLASDIHLDCQPKFAKLTTRLFNYVLENEIIPKHAEVIMPFSKYTKVELIVEYLRNGYSLDELEKYSWSCYSPENNNPCHKCHACLTREKAIREAVNIFNKTEVTSNEVQERTEYSAHTY